MSNDEAVDIIFSTFPSDFDKINFMFYMIGYLGISDEAIKQMIKDRG